MVEAFIVQSCDIGTIGSNSSISGDSEDDGLSEDIQDNENEENK